LLVGKLKAALALSAAAPLLLAAVALAEESQAADAAAGQAPPSTPAQPGASPDQQAADGEQGDSTAEDAKKNDDQPERIVVFGRSLLQIGKASSASEGVIGYADLSLRPLLRTGELVEAIPGMIATQHSGGGKANQYFLRGFNLDHGTDFAGSIDGVPLNLQSHPHMNGYLDINFLIPEVIETENFEKGAQYADHGDFAFAAAVDFNLYSKLPQGTAQLELGTYNFGRAMVADSVGLGGDSNLLYAVDVSQNDGPWDVPEHLRHYSGILKYTRPLGNATLSLLGIGYNAAWTATDQMPLRAIEEGLISRFGSLDPSLGGLTHRFIGSARLDWDHASLQVYAENYALNLMQDPTFFIDQVHGDQFEQVDRSWIYGASGHISQDLTVAGLPVDVRVGFDTNYDDIGKDALYLTQVRAPYQTVRNDSVSEATLAEWGEATIHWTDKLRTTLGVRNNTYWWDVRSLMAENSGSGSQNLLTPKLAVAYELTQSLELYGDYGEGFHSNDVRAATTTVNPQTGEPATPAPVLVKGKSGEVGFRYQPSPAFNVSVDAFHLALASELIFAGDEGTSEPSGGTERYGIETSAFWRPYQWLTFDASASWAHARFTDAPGQSFIPNSLTWVGGAGATITTKHGLSASFRMRYQGPSPLIEDNSVRSDAHIDTNLGISQDIGRFSVGLNVLNVFNEQGEDIEYWYASQLKGEPTPVDDFHLHPETPRTFKLILKAHF
jgi:hypothetical protein